MSKGLVDMMQVVQKRWYNQPKEVSKGEYLSLIIYYYNKLLHSKKNRKKKKRRRREN